jgi:hypothetical protein
MLYARHLDELKKPMACGAGKQAAQAGRAKMYCCKQKRDPGLASNGGLSRFR